MTRYTRSSHALLAAVGLLLLGSSAPKSFAQGSPAKIEDDKSALLLDIIVGWQRLEQIDDETKSCQVLWTRNSGGVNDSIQARLANGENRRLFSAERFVFSSAPWYGFLIARADAVDSHWLLNSMLTPEQLNDPKMRDGDAHPLGSRLTCFRPLSQFGTGGIRLAKMAEVDRLTIEKVEHGEGDLIIISYSGRYKKADRIDSQGRMVLDKSAFYCPVEISRKNSAQPDILIEEKRTLDSKQPVRCGSYVYRVTNPQFGPYEMSMSFSDYSSRLPSDEELTLSHYGLPEPVGIELPPKRTPRYVWLLAIAGGCVLFAFLFRRLARRRSTAVPS